MPGANDDRGDLFDGELSRLETTLTAETAEDAEI
jgi:hypothetical protein